MERSRIFMEVLIIAMMLLVSTGDSFKLTNKCDSRSLFRCASPIAQLKKTSNTQLHMDATLIPMVIGATGLIFAVFSFDNKIDLTDSGMAKAKALRYNARKEKGEIPSREALANADPYRWFADEDEEVDILTPKKKKGGGCG